mgnify:CR=1 FL=1
MDGDKRKEQKEIQIKARLSQILNFSIDQDSENAFKNTSKFAPLPNGDSVFHNIQINANKSEFVGDDNQELFSADDNVTFDLSNFPQMVGGDLPANNLEMDKDNNFNSMNSQLVSFQKYQNSIKLIGPYKS